MQLAKKDERTAEIVKTLLVQINQADPLLLGGAKMVIAKVDGIRLHYRTTGAILNIDVMYNRGLDLYSVQAYKFNHNLDLKDETLEDHLYADMLVRAIHKAQTLVN